MSSEGFHSLVLEALREVQTTSGREWTKLHSAATPIGTLDGFDSLTAIEATVLIETKLGCNLGLDSLFVSDDGKRALTLKQICERIAERIEGRGGNDEHSR